MKKYVKSAYNVSMESKIIENVRDEVSTILNSDESENKYVANEICQLLYYLVDSDQEDVEFSGAYNNALSGNKNLENTIDEYIQIASNRNKYRI